MIYRTKDYDILLKNPYEGSWCDINDDIRDKIAHHNIKALTSYIVKYANAVHEKTSYVQVETDFDELEGRQQNSWNRDFYFCQLRILMDECEEECVSLPDHIMRKGRFALVTAGLGIIEEGKQIISTDWDGTHVLETDVSEGDKLKFVLYDIEYIVKDHLRKLKIIV